MPRFAAYLRLGRLNRLSITIYRFGRLLSRGVACNSLRLHQPGRYRRNRLRRTEHFRQAATCITRQPAVGKCIIHTPDNPTARTACLG